VGINTEESLASSDENGKMKNGIWDKLAELDPIENEKGTKKFVGKNAMNITVKPLEGFGREDAPGR
jgi:hypothetical protein